MLGMATTTHAAQAVSVAYLWVEIIVGGLAILAATVAAVRWLRRQGADAAKLDARWQATETRLAAIEKAIRPNGKDTQQLGDIAARTEEKLDALDSKLDRHIGSQAEVNKQMWREIRRVEREAKT